MFSLNVLLLCLSLMFASIYICEGVPVGGSCSRNEDCDGFPEQTICDDILRVCFCNEEHIPVAGSPLTCEPVGEPCRVDEQCRINLGNLSVCDITQRCSCFQEAVPNNNLTFCLPIINVLGGFCQERQQCTFGVPGAYSDCVESFDDPNTKICNCTEGATSKPGSHTCLLRTGFIGQACEVDGDCVGVPGVSSACSKAGICLCLGGHIPSSQMDDCLEIKNKLGENCMESHQCQQGIPGALSACILGSCRCTRFSINEPGQHLCHRKGTLVGDLCQVHEQCWSNLLEKSYCLGGKCECTNNSQPSFDLSKCI